MRISKDYICIFWRNIICFFLIPEFIVPCAIIGNPGKPFNIMLYGKPGSGKSTLTIEFAHYLAREHNKKVLYIADEEKLGQILHEKIKLLKAIHKNLYLADKTPSEEMKFDFIFIDSVNSMKFEPQCLNKLDRKFPKTSFIYIFQTTKEGIFKGQQELEHLVDTVIKTEITDNIHSKAFTEKNMPITR